MKITKLVSLALFLTVLITSSALAVEREGVFDRASKTVDALVFVRNEIDKKYETYLNSAGSVENIIADKLPPLVVEINTLAAQLSTLQLNLTREEVNLENLQEATRTIQLELVDLEELSEMREVEMARSRDLLDEFIRIAYAETMQYTDWETGDISTLKFFFTDESLAEVETKKTYLDILQNISAGLILDLQKKQVAYEAVKSSLLAKRGQLILLQQEIMLRTRELAEMRDAKRSLLNQTRGQEAVYRKLVEESQRQQLQALAEVAELKLQLGVIDSQLKTLKGELSAEDFAELLERQSIASFAGVIFPDRIPKVLWPASPGRGITAYYQDPSYKAHFGVAHQAIDFRLTQGSRVTAAAPGIIYKAKDNGSGYSYVTIAHPGGLATVYGHISKIFVKEGALVRAGDLIGLSGGIPGTAGAGYMTTGAHLHFEVIDNGDHVDPLDYLPLEKMRYSDIPKKYLEGAVKL